MPKQNGTSGSISYMSYSAGSLVLKGPPLGEAVVEFWNRLLKDRNSLYKRTRTFGLVTLLRALLGRLDSKALCQRIETLTGARVRLVPLSDGQAAVDVDKPADLILAEELLAQRSP